MRACSAAHIQNEIAFIHAAVVSKESIQDKKSSKFRRRSFEQPALLSLVTGQKSILGQEKAVAGCVHQVVACHSAFLYMRLSVPGEVVCSSRLAVSYGGL